MAAILYYAIPFFVLLLIAEAISYRHLGEDMDLVGYELRDTRTSMTMGLGNVAINVAWKLVVLATYVTSRSGCGCRWSASRRGWCCSPSPGA